MEKPKDIDIESLIDKKILEAKLEITEKRLQIFMRVLGASIALFGVLLPIWTAIHSNQKVDKAVVEMEQKFEKLAGEYIGEPELVCYYKGEPLEGNLVKYNVYSKNGYYSENLPIEFRNEGKSTAKVKRVLLYLNIIDSELEEHAKDDLSNYRGSFQLVKISDEHKYNLVYELAMQIEHDKIELQPKESGTRWIHFPYYRDFKPIKSEALLKVFYGQPEPLRVNFRIEEKRIEEDKQ